MFAGCWGFGENVGGGGDREGQACLWRGWAGRKAPQWKAVPLSAGCSDSGLSLVDVEVSEVVEGRTKGPARLHVVYLLGQLESKITVGSPLPPHSGHMFPPSVKNTTIGACETRQGWAFSHLQYGAVLEAEALLQQTSDVRHVHAEEGADGTVFGHFVAHCKHRQ